MTFTRHSAAALSLFFVLCIGAHGKQALAANPPDIVVTIKPIHSLLSAVADGVFEPHLLLDGVSSPHHFQLKPSAVKLIHQSDRLFWVGEGLESFLIKTLRGVTDQQKAQRLIDVPGLLLLPLREKNAHNHAGEHDHDKHGGNSDQTSERLNTDNHFWLDPHNASLLLGYFADSLADLDPVNAETYRLNAIEAQDGLDKLTDDLDEQLKEVQSSPYLLFHDSFQYFENRFGLNSAGVISLQPDAQPSAKRIKEIQHLIEHESVQCLFSEPQFQSRSVQMLVADADINHAIIDPLGAAVPASATMYVEWLRSTATTLKGCLSE